MSKYTEDDLRIAKAHVSFKREDTGLLMSEWRCMGVLGALSISGLVLTAFAYATLDSVFAISSLAVIGMAIVWVALCFSVFKKNWK